MSSYSIARRTAAAAAGAAFAQFLTTDPNRGAAIKSITAVVASAVAGEIGLIRDLTRGTRVAASTQAGQPWNILPAGQVCDGALTTAWAVAPTIAATPAYLGRVQLAATIGAFVTWNFEGQGLILTPEDTGSILLWNFGAGAGPLLDVSVEFEQNLLS